MMTSSNNNHFQNGDVPGNNGSPRVRRGDDKMASTNNKRQKLDDTEPPASAVTAMVPPSPPDYSASELVTSNPTVQLPKEYNQVPTASTSTSIRQHNGTTNPSFSSSKVTPTSILPSGMYEIAVPVTEKGLMFTTYLDKPSKYWYVGHYIQHDDGSAGYVERMGLIRNQGDWILSIDGVRLRNKTAQDLRDTFTPRLRKVGSSVVVRFLERKYIPVAGQPPPPTQAVIDLTEEDENLGNSTLTTANDHGTISSSTTTTNNNNSGSTSSTTSKHRHHQWQQKRQQQEQKQQRQQQR